MEVIKKLDLNFLKTEFLGILSQNEPLESRSTYRVGGIAEWFFEPSSVDEISRFFKKTASLEFSVSVLGGGANVLISDDGVPGLLVSTKKLISSPVLLNNESIEYSSGTSAQVVLQDGLTRNRKGYAFLAGIPGTIGGALVMNAGTHVGNIVDIIESCEVVQKNGDRKLVRKEEMGLSYRKSEFLVAGDLITKVTFKNLGNDESGTERALLKESLERRKKSQPLDLPSCGSVFKNPLDGPPAGKLIEECGLKGKRRGCAVVSEKHANFIVIDRSSSEPPPRAQDIYDLAKEIKKSVQLKFQIELELEMKLLGPLKFVSGF